MPNLKDIMDRLKGVETPVGNQGSVAGMRITYGLVFIIAFSLWLREQLKSAEQRNFDPFILIGLFVFAEGLMVVDMLGGVVSRGGFAEPNDVERENALRAEYARGLAVGRAAPLGAEHKHDDEMKAALQAEYKRGVIDGKKSKEQNLLSEAQLNEVLTKALQKSGLLASQSQLPPPPPHSPPKYEVPASLAEVKVESSGSPAPLPSAHVAQSTFAPPVPVPADRDDEISADDYFAMGDDAALQRVRSQGNR